LATPPSGFTFESGGLNSSGCNGQGNFFCFAANSVPNTLLPSGSSLSFNFSVAASNFDGYDPDFKINWVGTQRNYNLVSLPLSPTTEGPPTTELPEPGMLPLFAVGLAGLLFVRRRATA
jgi:hypothetical protein